MSRFNWQNGLFFLGLGALCLGGIPNAFSPFTVTILLTVMIYGILALGLNIVIGYTGLLDLGYASFMAIGAFVVALGLVLTHQPPEHLHDLPISSLGLSQAQRSLTPAAGQEVVVRRHPGGSFEVVAGAPSVLAAMERGEQTISAHHESGLVLPVGQTTARGSRPFNFPGGFFLLVLLAGLLCAGFGLLRGFPTLHLTGDYYAIVTLGVAEVVWLVTLNEDWLTGGAFGIKLSMQYRPELFGDALYSDTWQFYFITYFCLLLSILGCFHLQSSRLGRAWAAIKADETAARSSGINVERAKMLAFAFSGFLGGVGGALFAIKLGTVTAKQFDIWQSIMVVCCLVLGGMGTIRGAVTGAFLLIGLQEVLRLLSGPDIPELLRLPLEARFLVYGLILVLLMRFRPQGLLPASGQSPPPSDEELAALKQKDSPLFRLGEGHAQEASA